MVQENLVDFSTPSVKQCSDFFMYLYQDLNRRPSTIDGYRTAIVDTIPRWGSIFPKVRPQQVTLQFSQGLSQKFQVLPGLKQGPKGFSIPTLYFLQRSYLKTSDLLLSLFD